LNPIHIHLVLNDIPVLGCIAGAILLFIGYIRKSNDITQISYWLIFIVSIIAVPVYSTGNLAEHMIDTLPNMTDQITNKHESSALFSFASIMILGVVAATVITIYRNAEVPRQITIYVFIFTVFTSWFMVETATTGGDIRHTELREGHPDQQATIERKKSGAKNPKQMEKPHASRSGPIKNKIKLR